MQTNFILLIVGILSISLFISYLYKIKVSKSIFSISHSPLKFPTVSGQNLDRKTIVFPSDFQVERNLVIIAFKQNQQQDVNTWLPFAQEIEKGRDDFRYYELPTIYEMSSVSRIFLNEGMRAGIPDQLSRERTITLYIDKLSFRANLNIPNEEEIQIFLLRKNGDVIWRETGIFNEKKGLDLIQILGDVT